LIDSLATVSTLPRVATWSTSPAVSCLAKRRSPRGRTIDHQAIYDRLYEDREQFKVIDLTDDAPGVRPAVLSYNFHTLAALPIRR
jgi:hypothetical protein